MTLGPRPRERCKNTPTVIAIEKEPGKKDEKGYMSLCADCIPIMQAMMGEDHVDLIELVQLETADGS
jgi:hypothetical protein